MAHRLSPGGVQNACMPKCRPGDLAVVVEATYTCNLGNVVHVLRLDDRKGDITFGDEWGTVWWVRCARKMKWTQHGKTFLRTAGPVPDCKLQPIRGSASVKTDAARQEEFVEFLGL